VVSVAFLIDPVTKREHFMANHACVRPDFHSPKRNSIDPEEKFVGQWICKSLRILNRESRKLLKLQALGLVLHLLLNVADAIGAYRLASISANWARNPFHDSAEPMRFWRLCSGTRCECLLPILAFRTSYVEQTIETAGPFLWPIPAEGISRTDAREGDFRRKDEEVLNCFTRIGNGPCDFTRCVGGFRNLHS
jgi:hypothetical protein